MNGKELHLVDKYHKWNHIPIAIGGSAPSRYDLIEFEELMDYKLEVVKKESKPISQEQNLFLHRKKKTLQRKEERSKLKAKIFNNTSSSASKDRAAVSSRKRKKKNFDKTYKKSKLENTSSDSVSSNVAAKKNSVYIDQDEEKEIKQNMVNWSNLNVPIPVLKSLNELNFTSPMPIQKQVLPAAILEKRDILGSAETGSGKTLAFGIPLIHHLLEDKKNVSTVDCIETNSEGEDFDESDLNALIASEKKKTLPALVLAPTRELAIQVTKHLKNVAKYTDLWIIPVVGGMAPQKQLRLLKKKPDIVIATPGRLWDMINAEETTFLSQLDTLRYLVIDEADRMLEPGHFEDLTKLLSLINSKDNPTRRQTLVFSATLTITHSAPSRYKFVSKAHETKEMKLSKLMKKIGVRNKPHVVDLTTEKVLAASLDEGKVICEMNEKDFYLYYFLKTFPGKTLVFTNSIDCIFRLTSLFELLQCDPLQLHAKMQQRQRLKHLDRFQQRDDVVMFASDVAARGLDIPNVNHVIHYQSPRTVETYVHRSGRCARSGKRGYSLLLLSPRELQFYKRLCGNLSKEEGLPDFVFDPTYMSAIQKRVAAAREVDTLLHRKKKVHLNNNWFIKAAKAIEMDLDDGLLIEDENAGEDAQVRSKKDHLDSLLKVPIFPKGFSGKYITREGSLMEPGFEKKSGPKNKKRRK